LIVQQNYFSDPAKILDLSAKSFFSCTNCFANSLLYVNMFTGRFLLLLMKFVIVFEIMIN